MAGRQAVGPICCIRKSIYLLYKEMLWHCRGAVQDADGALEAPPVFTFTSGRSVRKIMHMLLNAKKSLGWPELLSVQAESGNVKFLLGIPAMS